jgi:hypothetical protein
MTALALRPERFHPFGVPTRLLQLSNKTLLARAPQGISNRHDCLLAVQPEPDRLRFSPAFIRLDIFCGPGLSQGMRTFTAA